MRARPFGPPLDGMQLGVPGVLARGSGRCLRPDGELRNARNTRNQNDPIRAIRVFRSCSTAECRFNRATRDRTVPFVSISHRLAPLGVIGFLHPFGEAGEMRHCSLQDCSLFIRRRSR